MKKSINRIMILSKRNLKEIYRDPISLIFMMLLPLVMEILFYSLFHDKTSQFEMKYLAPGIVVFSQSFLTLFTGLLIAVDRSSTFLTRLFVSKTKSYEFIIGYALPLVLISFIQSVLFFLVGGIIDSTLFGISMIFSILTSLLTSLLFIGLGILLGSLCNERSIGGVSSVIITGQSLLSGMWFPTEGLSGGFVNLMNCLPFKNATNLVQNVLLGIGNTLKDFVLPLIIIMTYSIVIFVLATIVFSKKMKSA